jgi:purine catabolism regulator
MSELSQQLRNLAEIADAVNSSVDLDIILDRIVYIVCRHSGWSTSSIMSVDEDAGMSELRARFDPYIAEGQEVATRWPLDTSPVALVSRSNQPVIIPDAQQADQFPGYFHDARQRGYRTVVVLPLHAKDLRGRSMALAVHSRQPHPVGENELAFLSTVCHLASIAMQKAHGLRQERMFADRMRDSVEHACELMRGVLSQDAAAPAVAAIEDLLGRPVAFVDLSGLHAVPGSSFMPDVMNDAEWAVHLRAQLLPQWLAQARQATHHGFEPRAAVALPGGAGDRLLPLLFEPLDVDGSRVGALVVSASGWSPDRIDLLLAEQARFAASVVLMREFIKFRSTADSQQAVMREVCAGDWGSDDDILARAARAGLPLANSCRILAVAVPAGAAAGAMPATAASRHRAVAQEMCSALRGAACVTLQADLYLVLVPQGAPASAHEAVLARCARRLAGILGAPPLIVPGPVCSLLRDYPAAWSGCQRMVGLALRFGRSGVVQPGDLGDHAELLSTTPAAQLQSFVQAKLGMLIAYDAQHAGAFETTLAHYFASGGRYQQAADAMQVHVSTLRYRLDRMRDLFGVDVNDADARFDLELALRIRRLQDPDGAAAGPHSRFP